MPADAVAAMTTTASGGSSVRVPTRNLVGGAVGSVGVWLATRFAAGFPPGAFPGAGRQFVGPGASPDLVLNDGGGYDGQFVYRLAIDPFTTKTTDYGITLYQPGYRQQRIMTALLAHVLHGLPGLSIAVSIIIVNAIAVVIALVAGVRLAESFGKQWQWGLLLAIPACLPASFALDLTEPVEWAGVLCGVLAARQRRWLAASIALTVAVLARETAGALILGYVVESVVLALRGRGDRARAWLALPIGIATAWQLRLWAVWGSIPALTGFDNTVVDRHSSPLIDPVRSEGASHAFPLFGIARTFLNGLTTGDTTYPALGVTYVIERIALLLLMATAAWLLVTRRARIGIALTTAWALAALMVLSMSGWIDDLQFLRPSMELWVLSLLVLAHTTNRWTGALVRLAAVIVAWQVLFGLIRG